MKITIIGWYGTETIGDRAILSGIIAVLSHTWKHIEINLGSIFPFFSERTVNEDAEFWKKITGKKIEMQIFDSKKSKELCKAIKNSDILIMGGGPLMHINELYMVDYAFKKAKKLNKKTIIFGCGIGPINRIKFQKVLISILKNSDITYLRDNKSLDTLRKIKKGANLIEKKQIIVSHDPAVIPCYYYKQNNKTEQKDYIAINLRRFPDAYSKTLINVDENIINFLNRISKNNTTQKIKLVPMHFFSAGNDDREYLYYLRNKVIDKSNIEIQNVPLNLEQTLKIFANAKINVGMRYHSVIFQTITNGNNYILDYTEPKIGKISGFIKDIDKNSFYENRYCNIQELKPIDFEFSEEKFNINLDYNDIITNGFSEIM